MCYNQISSYSTAVILVGMTDVYPGSIGVVYRVWDNLAYNSGLMMSSMCLWRAPPSVVGRVNVFL